MRKGIIETEDGFGIPYLSDITGEEKTIVIVAHGFASSKESPNGVRLLEQLPEHGIGVISFDFPAHGESSADGADMRLDMCVEHLKCVDRFIRSAYPDAEVGYFGSSFGAYVTMLFLMKYGKPGMKAFFRSAAVNMPELYAELSEEEEADLERQGYIWHRDSVRPLKITKEFLEDLKANDLFEIFDPTDYKLKMIHGRQDEDVDYDRALEFAERFGIELVTVDGGDHSLSIPGAPEKVMEEALRFFG